MSLTALKVVSTIGLIGAGAYTLSSFFPAPPAQVTAKQVEDFTKAKGFEKCFAFLTDINKTSSLLYCTPKTLNSRQGQDNNSQSSQFFYLSPNKNGELKTISKGERPNTIKVSFADSDSAIINHPDSQLSNAGTIKPSNCQMNPKCVNNKFQGLEISCHKNNKWSAWDEGKVTWELKVFK